MLSWLPCECSIGDVCTILAQTCAITLNFQAGVRFFKKTRPKPAYGWQGLDWIIEPGYSFVVFSTNRGVQLTSLVQKRDVTHGGVQLTTLVQKRDRYSRGSN